MTYKQIKERFEQNPASIELKELRAKRDQMSKDIYRLILKERKLVQKEYDFQDKIADQLDVEFKDWRDVLVQRVIGESK